MSREEEERKKAVAFHKCCTICCLIVGIINISIGAALMSSIGDAEAFQNRDKLLIFNENWKTHFKDRFISSNFIINNNTISLENQKVTIPINDTRIPGLTGVDSFPFDSQKSLQQITNQTAWDSTVVNTIMINMSTRGVSQVLPFNYNPMVQKNLKLRCNNRCFSNSTVDSKVKYPNDPKWYCCPDLCQNKIGGVWNPKNQKCSVFQFVTKLCLKVKLNADGNKWVFSDKYGSFGCYIEKWSPTQTPSIIQDSFTSGTEPSLTDLTHTNTTVMIMHDDDPSVLFDHLTKGTWNFGAGPAVLGVAELTNGIVQILLSFCCLGCCIVRKKQLGHGGENPPAVQHHPQPTSVSTPIHRAEPVAVEVKPDTEPTPVSVTTTNTTTVNTNVIHATPVDTSYNYGPPTTHQPHQQQIQMQNIYAQPPSYAVQPPSYDVVVPQYGQDEKNQGNVPSYF